MKNCLFALSAFCFFASSAFAEIPEADFTAAIEKYLATPKGKEVLGKTFESYMQEKQAAMRKEQEERQAKMLEDQFKNPVKIDAGNSPSKGPANAKVTIIEFSDFQCPYCSKGKETMDQVLKAYPNDVRVVFKNMPLSFHKEAEPAARAALAAHKQGKFWEMHDALFAKQADLSAELYTKTAESLGLDLAKFKADFESEELKKAVAADMELATKNGITGTPGFFVNGVAVRGAYPYEHFKSLIDRWLANPAK
jgi:protein-disulfide isomerase